MIIGHFTNKNWTTETGYKWEQKAQQVLLKTNIFQKTFITHDSQAFLPDLTIQLSDLPVLTYSDKITIESSTPVSSHTRQ